MARKLEPQASRFNGELLTGGTLRRATLIVTISLAVLFSYHQISSQRSPYARDDLILRFAAFADSVTVHFIASGVSTIGGIKKKASASCTGVTLKTLEKKAIGFTAGHCIVGNDRFEPQDFHIDGLPALATRQSGRLDVAIWEGAATTGAIDTPIAQGWGPGDRVFVACIRKYKNSYQREYTSGYAINRPGDYVLGTWGGNALGDLAHTAPTLYGCSGGGVFLFNESRDRFELLAITTAFSVVGGFSYASSIDANILGAARDETNENLARFANWDTLTGERREEWLRLWRKNTQYTLRIARDTIEFVMEIEGARYEIGPWATVFEAWLEGRIASSGKLQAVDWREFKLF